MTIGNCCHRVDRWVDLGRINWGPVSRCQKQERAIAFGHTSRSASLCDISFNFGRLCSNRMADESGFTARQVGV
jgi:hypothetical protein